MKEPTRAEDDVLLYALQLFDQGIGFDEIARQLERPVEWLKRQATDVFLQEAAQRPIH